MMERKTKKTGFVKYAEFPNTDGRLKSAVLGGTKPGPDSTASWLTHSPDRIGLTLGSHPNPIGIGGKIKTRPVWRWPRKAGLLRLDEAEPDEVNPRASAKEKADEHDEMGAEPLIETEADSTPNQ